jgi:homoserine O-succinyltransferase
MSVSVEHYTGNSQHHTLELLGDDGDATLTIGLVNLMPRSAMPAAERQFTTMLRNAAGRRNIEIQYFRFDGADLRPFDGDIPEPFWQRRLDGLIVTGTEPQAQSMVDEPSWPVLVRLVEWAATHSVSAIWSCFAAHAAVYYLDGIVRQPFANKLSGVFTVQKNTPHMLTASVPLRWMVPHSRYNTLPETELLRYGYQILSNAPEVGADSFTKPVEQCQFLFFQGHLEYGPEVLLGEYSRDARRYFVGERQCYPHYPENYFPNSTVKAFRTIEQTEGSEENLRRLLAVSRSAAQNLNHGWRDAARQFYSSWLTSMTVSQSQLAKAES